jgi:all-trans-retinol 13,14-reductase
MRYDFVVIGAGVSGITSAITLAENGYHVALLEKANCTAPLLRGFSRQGVHFDTGFHYSGGLGVGEPLDLFFRYLGLSDRISSYPFAAEGSDLFRCERPDFEFQVPTGYARLEEKLGEAFPAERIAIKSYLAQVRSICATMPYLNLDAEIDPNAALRRILGPTLREILDALTGNVLLKSVLSMHTLLYGVSCDEVSFAQHAAIVGNYYQSTHGIRGGGLRLACACDARLAELGVDVLCSSEVTGMITGPGGALAGVEVAGGDMLACNAAIATVHPRLLLNLAPEGTFRPAYRKRLGALEETVSAFLCFAVTKNPLPSLAGANRFLLPDADCLSELGKRPVGAAPLYLSAAYRAGESDPHGFIGICPVKFTETTPWESSSSGRRPESYRQFKAQALGRMQSQIERAYPDLAGNIQFMEGSTPLTLRDFCTTPLGGLYGVKHMVGQYNPHPVTRIPGLFLAGQAVVAPGVMGAVISGLLACGTILGHDLMRKKLKACC